MKYSINGTGNIVAERDIYSLGGFIPKGTVGGKIASEAQLSQDGECWLAGGGIAKNPQVRITDNAYVGGFVESGVVYTDNEILISGDTLIPGQVCIRSLQAHAAKNNIYVKDSFIGVTMDVLCGPVATASAFPFEQGQYNQNAPKGTLFTSAKMKLDAANCVRCTATIRQGRDTYLYTPSGYNARIFWAYTDTTGQLAFSGETLAVSQALTKLDHPVYKLCMVSFAKAPTLTPAELLASGAKILGHVSGSVRSFINGISASGNYVMDNCRATWNVSDFSFSTDRHAMFAGFARNCNMNFWNANDLDVCGRFSNIEQLDLYRLMKTSDYTNPNRDTFITASDCPLLRVTATFSTSALKNAGTLVIRRCIVPRAVFTDNLHNNNVYEDIDFSYANEFVETKAGNTNDLWSSHIQGLYSVIAAGVPIRGFVSKPDNLALGSVISSKMVNIPLDGNIIEQGTYTASIGQFYEDGKSGVENTRLRTGKPVSTRDLNLPGAPSGYVLAAAHYLDEGFRFANSAANPTSINTAYPYVVFVIAKTVPTDEALASEFIALNRTMTYYDFSQVPEITGSAYVGAGVTVRGDVKLIGDPYVNRVFDVNMWERGNAQPLSGGKWQDGFFSSTAHNRYRSKDLIPVEPGGTVSRTAGGKMVAWFFDEFGNRTASSGTGWASSFVVPANVYFVGIVLGVDGDGLIEDSDIPLANVKYLRAFEKRRYITNELDRVSPEDILLGPGFFEQGGISIAEGNAGNPYEELKIGSPYRIRLKRPFGLGAGYRVTFSSAYSLGTNYYDAVTKLLYGSTSANMNNALFALVGSIAGSPTATITPADVTAARAVIEFTPTPRIIVPYGSDTLFISGPKIRMYDNAVLSRNLNQQGEIVLSGDAVMGYDFNSGSCMCSKGHSDAIN